jgi:hypothetical protein
MIQTLQQQIALVQQYIKTIELTCTNPLVLEQAYNRLAELQGLVK